MTTLLRRAVEASLADDRLADDRDELYDRYLAAFDGFPSDRVDEAFDAAAALLSHDDAAHRAAGADVLGRLGTYADEHLGAQATTVLLDFMADEAGPYPLQSAVAALGHLADARAAPAVLRLVSDPSVDVRYAVASTLPLLRAEEHEADIVRALMLLMTDEDEDVRDWATFGLGSQLDDIDSVKVRDALAHRTYDVHVDTRSEAIAGLAHRKDPRVVDRLLDALDQTTVMTLDVASAAVVGDPRLHPALLRISQWWTDDDPDAEVLGCALAACDPDSAAAGEG